MNDHLYRVRITEYPAGALTPLVEGKPGDCEVA
jgi:hypothetical protein